MKFCGAVTWLNATIRDRTVRSVFALLRKDWGIESVVTGRGSVRKHTPWTVKFFSVQSSAIRKYSGNEILVMPFRNRSEAVLIYCYLRA
jgi:hypothetical protein